MTEQIHKRLTEEQVKMILNRYNNNELSREQAMELLGLKRRQFFEWLKKHRENRKDFSICLPLFSSSPSGRGLR